MLAPLNHASLLLAVDQRQRQRHGKKWTRTNDEQASNIVDVTSQMIRVEDVIR